MTINNLFNPYAAVPSMHVAFALMIGVPLARLVKWRALKVFWAMYPLIVVFVIVATANHFIADAVLGACAAGIGALAARALARDPPAGLDVPARPARRSSQRHRSALMAAAPQQPATDPDRDPARPGARPPLPSGASSTATSSSSRA